MNIKIYYQTILLCVFIAITIGCSKKADETIAPSVLIGSWKDAGIKGTISIDFMGQKLTQSLDDPGKSGITEFKSDGTLTESDYVEGDLKFTKYKNTSTQLILTGVQANKSYDITFNFVLKGSTLLLSLDKVLFGKNAAILKAAGVDSELTDFNEFVPYITDFKYEQIFLKQ